MLDAFGEHRLEAVEPGGQVHTRYPEQQIRTDIREPAAARRAERCDRVRAGMEPFEKTQRVGPKTLHADAEPVDAGIEPASDVLCCDIARVGFERHLSPRRQTDRPHALQHLHHLGSRQQARRAAPDEDRFERADG